MLRATWSKEMDAAAETLSKLMRDLDSGKISAAEAKKASRAPGKIVDELARELAAAKKQLAAVKRAVRKSGA